MISHDFVNAKGLSMESPDTFEVPSDKELNEISKGMFVKVCHNQERFWVEIKSIRRDGSILGRVDNNLLCDHDFDLNSLVEFERSNIFSLIGKIKNIVSSRSQES